MLSLGFRSLAPIKRHLVALSLITAFILHPVSALANGIKLIRDAEIESIFRRWATPILETANLDPDQVKIHLVNDPTLNMFVAGGQRIFIHTGFIMAIEDPAEAVGVLAHEIGHIAGGHIARRGEQAEKAEALQWATIVLGALLVGASGGKAVGAGATLGSSGGKFAYQNLMAYSRVQESAADQAAIKYLKRTGYTADGLTSFLSRLYQRNGSISRSHEYLSSHPLTEDRIEAVTVSSQNGKAGRQANDLEREELSMMQAKLIGYLYPEQVNNWYGRKEKSAPAQYAWSIAEYRTGQIENAKTRLTALINRQPENPWLAELMGQILSENGDYAEALPWYEKTMHMVPHNLLIKELYGQILVKEGSKDSLQKAEGVLKAGRLINPFSIRIQDALARLYYQTNRPALSDLAAAEVAMLRRQPDQARYRVERALKGLDPDSPDWFRAKDLHQQLAGDQGNKKN